MTNQELYYNVLKKKYNILKKNLIIIEQTEEKINEFKNTIKRLDDLEQERYINDLELTKQLTTNLEDEYKRLCNCINLIEQRVRSRNNFLEDYNNIVKEPFDELDEIVDYNNLEFYNNRLNDIGEYLSNNEKYEKLVDEKNVYLIKVKELEEKYSNLDRIVNEFELNLLIKLKDSINSNCLYNNLNFDDIDDSVNIYSSDLDVKERELNTYLNSYNALIESNISDEEKIEYENFINEEKNDYLKLLEKKYILLIYKYINSDNIDDALKVYEERLNKLNMYNLSDNSNLKEVFEIIDNFIQKKDNLNDVKLELNSINENIDYINLKIDELVKELNKENIINLLKEFCIEKEYIVNNNFETDKNEIRFDDIFVDNIDEKTIEKQDIEKNIEVSEDVFEVLNSIDKDYVDEKIVSNVEIQSNNALENIDKEEIFDYLDDELINNDLNDTNVTDLNEEKNLDSKDLNNKIIEDSDSEYQKEFIYKDNAVIELKDISLVLPIDTIRQKALDIMKSVCQSVI